MRVCGISVVIESDAPDRSVIETATDDALSQSYTGLGKTGRDSALVVQKITPAFVEAWESGSATEDCLVISLVIARVHSPPRLCTHVLRLKLW